MASALSPVGTESSNSMKPDLIQLDESSRIRPRALLTELQAIESMSFERRNKNASNALLILLDIHELQ